MHLYIRFLAAGFLVIAQPAISIYAQVPTTDTEAELRIKDLEKKADSLKKEARHLKDSLGIKQRHKDFGNLFLNADSLWLKNFGEVHSWDSLPGTMQGWVGNGNIFPKDYHFETPNIPQYKNYDGRTDPFTVPKEEKKKSTVPGFKGWYMQQLAEL